MKHTRVVSTKCTPGFACRAFSDTTLVCFIVNEHTQPGVPAILSKRLEALVWRPIQDWYSSRSQLYHGWTFRTSVYRLNTVWNMFSYTSWRPVSKTGFQDVYEDLKSLTDRSLWRRIFKALLCDLQPKINAAGIQVVLKSAMVGCVTLSHEKV